jgi:hypothetical protein
MSDFQAVLFESDTRVFNPQGILYVDEGFRRLNGEDEIRPNTLDKTI